MFLIRKVRLFYDISGSIAQSKQDCTPRKVEKRVGFVKQIMGIPEDLLMTDKKNGSRGMFESIPQCVGFEFPGQLGQYALMLQQGLRSL